nr:MarR family transcriptional regulator [Ramlibacter aurantiacus]
MTTPPAPPASQDVFLFRLHKLAATASHPITRLCEGRYGITRREWRLILTLGRTGRLLSTELARKARLDPARASRGISLLVEKGLAAREPRPNDRRYVEIILTAEGRRIYDEMLPIVLDINEQLLSGLTDAEREMLDSLFARLEQRAESPLASTALPKINRQRHGRH